MKRAREPLHMPELVFTCEFHTVERAFRRGDENTQILVG